MIDRAPIGRRAMVREVQVARSDLSVAVCHRVTVIRTPLLSGNHLSRTAVLEKCAIWGVGDMDLYPGEYGMVPLHVYCPRSGGIVNGQVVERDPRHDV